jgi:biotin transport system substrate-specific component
MEEIIMSNRTKDLTNIALFAAIIFVASQDFLKIPIGPVPISLQTLAIMITASILGAKNGSIATAISILIYAFLSGKIAGPTVGYLISFPFAAYLIGCVHERYDTFFPRLLANVVGGIFLVYLIGVPVLKIMLGLTWGKAISIGMVSFLIGDVIKAFLATLVTQKIPNQFKTNM